MSTQYKLLIVDDSSIVRSTIESLLLPQTFSRIDQAENGNQAVEIFKREQHQIVTMDITMPFMDGLTCLEELLKINPDTEILLISALADRGTAIEGVKRGACGFLTKPFTSEEIREAMSELLGLS